MSGKLLDHLSHVDFARARPAPALRPFVDWYWCVRSSGHCSGGDGEFMHADGRPGLVFNWGDPLLWHNGAYPQDVVLDGLADRSRRLVLAGHIDAFGILLRPGGAFPVFEVAMKEVPGVVPASDLDGDGGLASFHDMLYRASSFSARVGLAEEWLLRRLKRARPRTPVIPSALDRITRARGQVSIRNLAEDVSLSTRQLQRLFATQVGLTPKEYARIMRVGNARTLLKAGDGRTAAEIALDAGFYDQPHFIREFRAVVGMTPGQYAARHRRRTRGADPPPGRRGRSIP